MQSPSSPPDPHTPAPKSQASWLNLLTDFGPLLVFFLTYRYFAPEDDDGIGIVLAVSKSTLAFMAATLVALIVSKWRLGRISPMVWLSAVLILGFGGLTVVFNDPFWIQVKPTAIYLMFAAVLFGGLLRGKAMLKYLLQSAFEGLSDEGWLKLSRNWAFFFILLAVINEVLRQTLSFGTWLEVKVWGFTVLSFVFTFSQIPMVMRHGMSDEKAAAEETITHPPHD